MNVFIHELHVHRKGSIIWVVSMFLFMVLCMAKYSAISEGGQAIQAMLSSFPSTVQAVFGMSGLDLATLPGYFGVCFLFMAVILAVHAGLTGAGILAEEEQDKTAEFLYVKPKSRSIITSAKLGAGLVNLVIVWGATTGGSVLGIEQFAHFGSFAPNFCRLLLAAALIQLLFFAAGTAAAAVSKKAGTYGKVVSITIFGSYLLYVIAKLSPSFSWVHYVSPFSWFDAAAIFRMNALELRYVIVSLTITVMLLIITYIAYSRRDLRI